MPRGQSGQAVLSTCTFESRPSCPDPDDLSGLAGAIALGLSRSFRCGAHGATNPDGVAVPRANDHGEAACSLG
jgi:hypothetical protein